FRNPGSGARRACPAPRTSPRPGGARRAPAPSACPPVAGASGALALRPPPPGAPGRPGLPWGRSMLATAATVAAAAAAPGGGSGPARGVEGEARDLLLHRRARAGRAGHGLAPRTHVSLEGLPAVAAEVL